MIQYAGLSEINGPLVCLEGAKGVSYDEIAEIKLEDGTKRLGRVVEMQGDKVVLQVFEGTNGISLTNTKISFTGKPLEIPLSTEMLGRTFNGAGDRRTWRSLSAEIRRYKRPCIEPRCTFISQKLYTHGYFLNRRTYDAYQRSETAYILRLRSVA